MRRTEAFLLLFVSLAASPAVAQVSSRPTDAPVVTAANASWYVAREPIQVGPDFYYPAGASVFFNGNTMVQTATYSGVPVFSDKTLEPNSVVYVPVGRGLMQPYEQRRDGNRAGTTASRAPSFPVSLSGQTAIETATDAIPAATTGISEPVAVGTLGTTTLTRPAPRRTSVMSVTRPTSDDGLWIQYLGEKWVSAGSALALTEAGFRQVGSYSGFPVYSRQGTSEQVIYIPTRDGYVAPYRLKQ